MSLSVEQTSPGLMREDDSVPEAAYQRAKPAAQQRIATNDAISNVG